MPFYRPTRRKLCVPLFLLKIVNLIFVIVENWSESQTLEQMDKKGLKFFMKRIQKLDNMRDVSRREHKLIRKLLRSNKNDANFSWETILFHFPGKRLSELQSYTIQNFPKYFQSGNSGNIPKLLSGVGFGSTVEE